MQLALTLLMLIFAQSALCRPAVDSDLISSEGTLVRVGSTSNAADNNGLPSEPASTTKSPLPPNTYRLGTRPGGLRLITEHDKDVRIIFLFDMKPVHLFRRQYISNKNALRNIITKEDV